ncbi:hypothetical protein RDWZM_004451, partial [Blomia tropicalis]
MGVNGKRTRLCIRDIFDVRGLNEYTENRETLKEIKWSGILQPVFPSSTQTHRLDK